MVLVVECLFEVSENLFGDIQVALHRCSIESRQHPGRERQVDTGTCNKEVQGTREALVQLGVDGDVVVLESTGKRIRVDGRSSTVTARYVESL